MRAGYGPPGLNENLNPLRRYLRSQVGRPWDLVFSEICAHIDRRSTVQRHVHQHIEAFIAIQVKWDNGCLVDLRSLASSLWHGHGLQQELYVDPRSGLIRVNKDYRTWQQRNAERTRKREAEIATRRRVLDANTMLLRLEGGWFWVEVDALPEKRFDVVLKRTTSPTEDRELRAHLYGRACLYGVKKRQISRREMKDFGVEIGSEPATAAVRQTRRRRTLSASAV